MCRPHKFFDHDTVNYREHLYLGHLGDPRFGEGHCEDDFGDHGKLFPSYHAGSYVMSSLTLRRLSCKFETMKHTQVYPPRMC